MTNDLFRDLLEGRIPGRETPRTVTITITPETDAISIYGVRYTRAEYAALLQASVSTALERMEKIREYMAIIPKPQWIDYGARQGLEGLERAHFNDAVEKMARANPWTREECATMLGKIMDLAAKAELGPLRHDPPADPRARALWAKEQQGHGPAMTPLRVHGRTTHYKEKP